MKYAVPDKDFVTPQDLAKRYGDFDPNVFNRWVQNGLLIKVRNGLYLTNFDYVKSEVDMFSLANRLYVPSYVSLQTALSYYSIIPEYAFEVISISTRKTKEFTFQNVRYRYRTLKPEMFIGYERVKWRGRTYAIANREKALVDYAYLEPQFNDPDWLEGQRFDADEITEMNWELIGRYGRLTDSDTVGKRLTNLMDVYDIR